MKRFVGMSLLVMAVASCRIQGPTPPEAAPVPVPVPVPTRVETPPPPAPKPAAPKPAVVENNPTRIIIPPSPAPSARATARIVPVNAPPVAREFRGVWVASVANIDWPSRKGLSTEEAQQELLTLLDRAVALKLNAVIFQVRPSADAFYASSIEPWSEYLTGTQGRAPSPMWDPLEFVIREAHARNLELHAWFNPYRAKHTDSKSVAAPSHISRTNPALVKKYAGYLWMDPGESAVRARTLRVILDVVKRYDVDGVHIDDYFYPYPENDRRGRAIEFPDNTSWRKYRAGGGKLSRDDWRRRNVDLLVEALHDGIHKTKPWVRFGISPFGIWRPGYPAQVRGLDAYTKLYADARRWLREGWLDYFTPQLYWPTTSVAQSYSALLDWWSDENVQDRHLWPGNFTSRAGGPGSSSFPVRDLLDQITITRAQPGASGNVHFSMKSFLINQAGMNDALMTGPYAQPALVPATPWLRAVAPPLPIARLASTSGASSGAAARRVSLSTAKGIAPWQWVVRLRTDTAWITAVLPGAQQTFVVPPGVRPTTLTVTTLNRVGTESDPVSLSFTER